MARVHFLNVEEGDCSLIQHDNGVVTMIDVCNASETEQELSKSATTFSEASESLSLPKGNFQQKNHPENPLAYLQKLGVDSIFRYIQTHPDMDHMDGLQYIANSFKIYNFWDTANTKEQSFEDNSRYDENDWKCYQRLRNSAESPKALYYYAGSKCKYFAEDDNGLKKDDYLQILAPTKELIKAANDSQDWNDSSYVVLYYIQGHRILFCGDAGNETWKYIIDKFKTEITNIDVLIAPHHGRAGTLDFSFLDILNPKLTLIGNALSKHIAYNAYSKRWHLTNNQAGNVVLDIVKGQVNIYCSNKSFVDKFLSDKDWATRKHNNLNCWYLGSLKTY